MTPTKAQVRAEILAARRALGQDIRDAEAQALSRHLLAAVTPPATVCAYLPVGSEPGSAAMIDDLVATGVTVLLPIARSDATDTPLPLQWARYTPGELVDAPFGLREPRGPRLTADAVAGATMVIVPALAVDRRGTRLGRGAGFYDRTLSLAPAGTPLIAVVRDDELVEHLTGEPHDVPMSHAITPGSGLVALAGNRRECQGPTGGSST